MKMMRIFPDSLNLRWALTAIFLLAPLLVVPFAASDVNPGPHPPGITSYDEGVALDPHHAVDNDSSTSQGSEPVIKVRQVKGKPGR